MEKIYKGEIQRLFPILEAIKEGKTIQWNDMGVWCDIDGDDEGFVLDTLIGKPDGYRIKPGSTYRPFKDAIECWTEMRKHKPFSILKDKKDGHRIQILSISDGINSISSSPDSNLCYNFKYRMESCTFDDGAPFSVKVEE